MAMMTMGAGRVSVVWPGGSWMIQGKQQRLPVVEQKACVVTSHLWHVVEGHEQVPVWVVRHGSRERGCHAGGDDDVC